MIDYLRTIFMPRINRLEYYREITNHGFGEEGSDLHIVHVNGMLVVFSYDDWRRTELDIFLDCMHKTAVTTAKRLKMPVRYYYRNNLGKTEYVHYDYRRRAVLGGPHATM